LTLIGCSSVKPSSLVSFDDGCVYVHTYIFKFKNNNFSGHDNIIPKLLKIIGNEIIDPLLYICNLCFSTGSIPNALKMAKVTTVYKKGDRCLGYNYRSISLLNIFDKILEKLMFLILLCTRY